jgi:hypothetical protein
LIKERISIYKCGKTQFFDKTINVFVFYLTTRQRLTTRVAFQKPIYFLIILIHIYDAWSEDRNEWRNKKVYLLESTNLDRNIVAIVLTLRIEIVSTMYSMYEKYKTVFEYLIFRKQENVWHWVLTLLIRYVCMSLDYHYTQSCFHVLLQ